MVPLCADRMAFKCSTLCSCNDCENFNLLSDTDTSGDESDDDSESDDEDDAE